MIRFASSYIRPVQMVRGMMHRRLISFVDLSICHYTAYSSIWTCLHVVDAVAVEYLEQVEKVSENAPVDAQSRS